MKRLNLLAPLLLMLVTACGSDSIDSSISQEATGPAYLALGDSISFGYSPLFALNDENVAAGKFVGYPELVAKASNFRLANASCAGETTASFIDNTQPDNGCNSGENPARESLKVEYDVSQLEFANQFLKAYPDTELVTLTIGGNDLLMLEDECDLQKIPLACKIARVGKTVLGIGKNVIRIVDSIRSTGYQGQIVFVTQYPRDFKDKIQTLTLGAIQVEVRAIAHIRKFKVASGFDAFKKATLDFDGNSCTAGLLIDRGDGTCNQHPSAKGAQILSQAVLDVLK